MVCPLSTSKKYVLYTYATYGSKCSAIIYQEHLRMQTLSGQFKSRPFVPLPPCKRASRRMPPARGKTTKRNFSIDVAQLWSAIGKLAISCYTLPVQELSRRLQESFLVEWQ